MTESIPTALLPTDGSAETWRRSLLTEIEEHRVTAVKVEELERRNEELRDRLMTAHQDGMARVASLREEVTQAFHEFVQVNDLDVDAANDWLEGFDFDLIKRTFELEVRLRAEQIVTIHIEAPSKEEAMRMVDDGDEQSEMALDMVVDGIRWETTDVKIMGAEEV